MEQAVSARLFPCCSAMHGSFRSSSDWQALLARQQREALFCLSYLNCFTELFLELWGISTVLVHGALLR